MGLSAFARSAVVLFALALLGMAALAARDHLRAVPLLRVADAVERSGALPKASERLQNRLARSLGVDFDCREPERRARVTTALFLLRLASEPGAAAADERLALARNTVAEALRCAPLDGHLWLASADLARRPAPDIVSMRQALSRSIAFAPFEGPVLANRAALLLDAGDSLQIAEDPLFRHDLENAVRYGKPLQAAQLLDGLTVRGFGALSNALFDGLDPDRRRVVEAAARVERVRLERLRAPRGHPALQRPAGDGR